MALETEIEYYNQLMPGLLEQGEGRFAVIAGKRLVGIFESNEAASTAGLDAVGLAPFLLRPILRVQPTIFLPSFFMRKSVG